MPCNGRNPSDALRSASAGQWTLRGSIAGGSARSQPLADRAEL